ncbi:VF530 family protein [Thauera aromatica]|nr:VF530 family protein [Thauera aromatica]MCK2128147.1 VF530 family protein [Thauera aromatica]
MTAPQPHNPLHGLTLERILNELVACYGWAALGRQIDIRCFNHEPGIASSLKFLRRTPWAREKVEALYLHMVRSNAAQRPPTHGAAPRSTPKA